MGIRLTAVVSFLFLLAGCGQKDRTPVTVGQALFNSYGCQSCHRIGSAGASTGPDLTLVGFRRSKEWLNVWMENPQGWKPDTKMPDPKLSPKNREAIVEYLSTLKGQDWKEAPWKAAKDPITMGKMIYSKAGCVACHARQGTGGHPNNNVVGGQIPALTKTVSTYKPEELKEKIRKGVKPEKQDPNGPEPLVSMPVWGEILNEQELDSVVQYLYTLSTAKPGDEW